MINSNGYLIIILKIIMEFKNYKIKLVKLKIFNWTVTFLQCISLFFVVATSPGRQLSAHRWE